MNINEIEAFQEYGNVPASDSPNIQNALRPHLEQQIDVSIVIKTLNEADNIARAIESALTGMTELTGEVIVADSLSTDETVQIAARYPVKVVQLANPRDRSCGAGPQLGFQHSIGEFVYILDGDMELDSEFITKAVRFLREHPDVAGVAGIVEELGGGNYEFEARKSQHAEWSRPGVRRWLDMGGLYRRSALAGVGYFSNRNLHACEEQDLGLRLSENGGRLVRLPISSVRHHGCTEGSWELMKQRFKCRYSDGPGELVRAAIGSPVFWPALKSHAKLLSMAGLWIAMASALLLAPWSVWPLFVVAILASGLVTAMLVRKRNVRNTLLGLANWNLRTAGFVRGLFSSQVHPQTLLESRLVSERQTKVSKC